VPKEVGEEAISIVRSLQLLNKNLKIYAVNECILIPLIRKPSNSEISEIKKKFCNVEVQTAEFLVKEKGRKTLLDVLGDKLPPHLLASLPKSMDIVGEIAVVEIPFELEDFKRLIGEAVLEVNKNVHTVLAKASAVSSPYRLREFDVIAGKGETVTVHKEYGCVYRLDLKRVYFSPRLSFERGRVASQVQEGEIVVDMFAGVGPFSILIAKKLRNVKVYAIDVNRDAVNFLKENIMLNKVWGKVIPIFGDADKIVREKLVGTADRVIMDLPAEALRFVEAACKALKPAGGIVHYYSFISDSDSLEGVKQELSQAFLKAGREIKEFTYARTVKPTAPHEWQIVIDAKVT
jgi:tRNA (guanine37-N1)-methyltransferase